MAVFDDIMSSLNELIDDAQGKETKVIKHKVSVKDVPAFSPEEIKEVRLNAGMTQWLFASTIGVSKKSVESWECGRCVPDGSARRMIGLIRDVPNFAYDLKLIEK